MSDGPDGFKVYKESARDDRRLSECYYVEFKRLNERYSDILNVQTAKVRVVRVRKLGERKKVV